MKKIILLLAFVLSILSISIAQSGDKDHNREESRKRIEASKVAYMTTYLDLSSDESAKFWPIYNQYQSELKALRGERGERKEISEMTDAEASNKLDQYIANSKKKLDLNTKYMTKFRSVLSDKKVLMLTKAEGEFKKQMVNRYADRRGSKSGSKGDHKK